MVTVRESVLIELDAMPARFGRSPEAAAALVLADALDAPRNSATSKSMCVRALAEVMIGLRDRCPPVVDNDNLDDLSERRETRRRGLGAEG